MKENHELNLAFDFVQFTNRNIFLTGKAGTGKTTFLHDLKTKSHKRMIVVAPTGVAAINAGGVTIHSFFQMPFGPILPGRLNQTGNSKDDKFIRKFNKKKINIIKSLDLLVIDEISMVRADLLDGIDQVLKRYKNKMLPFGGAQVLMIGDLQQLAPVVKRDEWSLLREHYETVYFFSSHVFKTSNVITVELKHIYRQQDNKFIKILNELRDNKLTPKSFDELEKRHIPGFQPKEEEGYITLTTHNASAKRINDDQLVRIKSKVYTFYAEVEGLFPEYNYPTDEHLNLKVGAQVMFVKNDSSYEKRYFNGKIGKIIEIDDDQIEVDCPGDEDTIIVGQEAWENVKYSINESSAEIREEVAGTFTQYPLRLAWAITIHKSQGLTFDKAIIDAEASFSHGQTYVALSRCKTMEGMVLSSRISKSAIITDSTVSEFTRKVEQNPPGKKVLDDSKVSYQVVLLEELFDYHKIQYQLQKCRNIIAGNSANLMGNISDTLPIMIEKGSKVLNEVSGKFIQQIKFLASKKSDIASNTELQERLKKGAGYFFEITEKELILPLLGLSYETDNRALEKSIKEVLEKTEEFLVVKKDCLDSVKNGFSLKHFLDARARSALKKSFGSKSKSRVEETIIVENPELLKRLRIWRNETAADENLEIYRVLPQKVLVELAKSLPGHVSQLKKVKGIGPKKLEKYGEIIIEIIKDYCLEKKIDQNLEIIPSEKKRKKPDTKKTSLEYFNSGKSIDEIAKERGFVVRTIEGHLAYFVGKGELSVDKFVAQDKIKVILDYFENNPESGLYLAKEHLGGQYSYSEIRFVRSYFDFKKS